MIPYLNIYGQGWWHQEAIIVGNHDGLVRLYNAVAAALSRDNGYDHSSDVYVNDGEGYDLHVICTDDTTMERLAVPYTDEVASEKDEDTIRPETLFKDGE